MLEALCGWFRPWPDARVVLLAEAPDGLFRGIAGAYGRVTGAPSALVMLGDERSSTAAEHLGYVGEAAVLEATSLGLGTCWVGGIFGRGLAESLIEHATGERVYAVSPVGHALEHPSFAERVVYRPGREKRRRSLDEIAPGCRSWPDWAQAGVRAAQVAPSAVNRQPWRFAMSDSRVRVSVAGHDIPGAPARRLDCGIAMLHFELGARGAGCLGAWETAAGEGVAEWAPRLRV